MGFNQLRSYVAFFIKHDSHGNSIIVLSYVDDLLYISNNEKLQKDSIAIFLSKFEGTQEPLRWYLGMNISIENDSLAISQSSYIDQLLQKFKYKDCKTFNTPMVGNFFDELKTHENDEIIINNDYRNIKGSLQYLAIRSRPDISLSVGI